MGASESKSENLFTYDEEVALTIQIDEAFNPGSDPAKVAYEARRRYREMSQSQQPISSTKKPGKSLLQALPNC